MCSSCIDALVGLSSPSAASPSPSPSPPQVRCPLCNVDVLLTSRLSNTVVCDLVQALNIKDDDEGEEEEEEEEEEKEKKKDSKDGDESKEERKGDEEEKDAVSPDTGNAGEKKKKKKKNKKNKKKKKLSQLAEPPFRAPGEAPRTVFTPSSPIRICLSNRDLFPSYECLPSDQELNEEWYTRKGQMRCPKVHWCFVGEVFRCEKISRFGIYVLDRDGKEVPVFFYCEPFDTSQFRVGSTVLVRYAERHQFMDTRWGLRVDHGTFVKALPLGLTNLTLYDQSRAEANDDRARGNHCQRCDVTPASVTCPDCKVIDYCSERCRIDGREAHRQSCELWQALNDVHHVPHGAHANDFPGSGAGQPIKLVFPFDHSIVGPKRR